MRRVVIGSLCAACLVLATLRAADLPPELVDFVPHSKNPVFVARGKGTWDEKIRERGWILKDGDVYKMWYTGYDPNAQRRMMRLGYATSKDGIHWQRHPKNPIHDAFVEDVMVVKHNGRYLMFAEGPGDRAQLLQSKDGIRWQLVGKLDVRMKNGKPISEGPYGTPTAWHEKGTWYLFYERRDLGIWLAKSKDLKVWTNVQDEPVLSPGPGQYDKDLVALNQIIKHKRTYYAFYHGSARSGANARLWCTCVATSPDLIHWRKYSKNPLLPIKANKSSGILVHDGERYRLYTMHDQVHLHLPR